MRTPEAVSAMLCPICKVGLAMSDRQGVEIDYCPQCRGVWLDRGELDKIIERSAAAEAPQHPQEPPRQQQPWGAGGFEQRQPPRQGYDPRYQQKRRKSWLEDIFD